MPALHPQMHQVDELEAAVDQAIAACEGDMRSAIRALILANDYLENEVAELMKAPARDSWSCRVHRPGSAYARQR